MKTKPHRKFLVTREWLQDLGACAPAIAALTQPIAISTDPEENIEIAIVYADHDDFNRRYDATWLKSTLALKCSEHPNTLSTWSDEDDTAPYAIAQYLAHIADYLLTKQGK